MKRPERGAAVPGTRGTAGEMLRKERLNTLPAAYSFLPNAEGRRQVVPGVRAEAGLPFLPADLSKAQEADGAVVRQAKLPPTRQASHRAADFRSGCSTSDPMPCKYTWEKC